jgi:hypothetical protein
MKIPLKYQSTEFDCVPTTFLNALNYLFDREEIPPEVVQRVLLYSLDTINIKGEHGKCGTTGLACEFLLQWLEIYSTKNKSFALKCEYLTGERVQLTQNNRIVKCVNSGGVALCSVCFDKSGSIYHYVLCIGTDSDHLYFFDPYYREQQFKNLDKHLLEWIKGEWNYNLKVSRERLESTEYEKYSFGPLEERSCCLIKRI